jgi:geranylgeranyl pyrophosphate synthase
MTLAVELRDNPTTLSELLETELSVESLTSTLGPESAKLFRHWNSALLLPLRSMADRRGKELRGRLIGIAWEMSGAHGQAPPELAAVVEGLHLGSLIVDDIEDGSTVRRGAPTLHEQIGVPLALNAGNWLYFWAAQLIGRLELPWELELAVRRAVDRAVLNCHFGQALDLSLQVTNLRQQEVLEIVQGSTRLKTGSLMELAARLGSVVAGGTPHCVSALAKLGHSVGEALQMLDDLTSITSDSRAHKGREDLTLGRPTWPWAWFAQSAEPMVYARLRLLEELVINKKADVNEVVGSLRLHVTEIGRHQIDQLLTEAIGALQSDLGEPPGYVRLAQWVQELKEYAG